MDCTLCKKPISDYDPSLNRIEMDNTHSADICTYCINKLMRWQAERIGRLFPTNAMKKRYGKRQPEK